MQRREFLRLSALLGIGGSVAAGALAGCGGDDGTPAGGFDGSVLVIGAGAAGMSAAYVLAQNGVDVRVLEAAPTYGGRIKRDAGFVDFPIPLGGEWLHEPPSELGRIVGRDDPGIPLAAYGAGDVEGYWDGSYSTEPLDWEDYKFVGATWLDIFERFIVPDIEPLMRFNAPVSEIDHRGERVAVRLADGTTEQADAVMVTVPLRALRDDLTFRPALPDTKRRALDTAPVWGGMKAFFDFSERFYPAVLAFPDSAAFSGQRLYYDAAHGQAGEANVLGLFSVGSGAEPYQQALADGRLVDHVLSELDEVFDGVASSAYLQHVAQDWNAEPFIGMGYLSDYADSAIPSTLFEPIDDRIFFAGDAYTNHGDWGAVDDAARAAREAVARLFR
jgi:monoamine oxidase